MINKLKLLVDNNFKSITVAAIILTAIMFVLCYISNDKKLAVFAEMILYYVIIVAVVMLFAFLCCKFIPNKQYVDTAMLIAAAVFTLSLIMNIIVFIREKKLPGNLTIALPSFIWIFLNFFRR